MTEPGPPMMPANGHDSEPSSYNVEGYTIVRLIAGDSKSIELFRAFHDRCLNFIPKIDSDVDPIWLGKLLYAGMAQPNNYVFMMVAIDGQDEMVGHMLAYPAPFERLGYVAFLLQVEQDHGVPVEVGLFAHDLLEEWTRGLGMKTILNTTHTLSRVKAFKRHGYELYRYTTRKDLEDQPPEGVDIQ